MSKRRRGFPSETEVKRGVRIVHGKAGGQHVEIVPGHELYGGGRLGQWLLPGRASGTGKNEARRENSVPY